MLPIREIEPPRGRSAKKEDLAFEIRFFEGIARRDPAFIEALRKIRFPRLNEAVDRLSAEIAALKLPSGIRVELPKDLGSDELMIRVSARTGRELEKLIDALAAKKSGLVRIAKMMGGQDGYDDDGSDDE